ncbi:MAG: ABC transporter substrate-binding protein [Alphaproteobacteria bacterium]
MTRACRAVALAATLSLVATVATAQDRLTVLLDWFVNPDHAPLVVAQERGIFAAHGLEVELVAPADPNDPPKLVAAGQAELAVGYQPQLHFLVNEGLPLMRVGTLVATPLNALVVLADSDIRSVADLADRRIGYSVAGFEDALLGAMLEHNGLGLDDVELINVNFSLSPALMAGQVDAVIGAFRNFELNQMAIEGMPGRAFYVEEEGVPSYDELIFLARPDMAGDPRLGRFMQALTEAVQYLVNHPDESWAMFVAAYPELDDELNRRAWGDTLVRFALRPAALDRGRYQRFADFLAGRGLIDAPPPVERYAVGLD